VSPFSSLSISCLPPFTFLAHHNCT
jgi:hypothetical protein